MLLLCFFLSLLVWFLLSLFVRLWREEGLACLLGSLIRWLVGWLVVWSKLLRYIPVGMTGRKKSKQLFGKLFAGLCFSPALVSVCVCV